MSTLEAYVRRALDLAGENLMGTYAPLTAAAAQTATAGSLAFGGNNEQMFVQWYLWRPAATTTADHDKQVDSWAPATGVFTHSGSAYSDTTSTGETLYLFPPDLNPRIVRRAADRAIRSMREWDETIIPIVINADEHYISDLDWLNDAASIRDIHWTQSPWITRNLDLQKRHVVNTSGVLDLDNWTVTSNAATTKFNATNYRTQKYYYSLERSGGTDATISQAVSTLRTGVDGDSPAGETITAMVVFDPGTAGDVLLTLTDGTTSATSTGSGAALQEATATLTLANAATDLTITVTAQTNNAAQKIYRAGIMVGNIADAARRNTYQRMFIPKNQYTFEQGGPLKIRNPRGMGRGSFVICSERPFPSFDATRLASGAADTDESDAPLDEVATGIVAFCLEQRFGKDNSEAKQWRREFDLACRKHLAYPTGDTGKPLLNGPITAAPLRVR